MFISNDGKHVALFDLLTWTPAYANGDTCPGDLMAEVAEQRALGQNVKDNLEKVARWGGQEISLEVTDDALIFVIFSCYEGREDPLLRVIVSKDKDKPIRVESLMDPIDAVIPERKVSVKP